MARRIIPNKIIFDFKDGVFNKGIFQYRIRIDGVLDNNYKSIRVDGLAFNKLALKNIYTVIRDHVIAIESAEVEA
jgi:hypothetical protein